MNTRIPDLGFHTDEALPDGGRRHEESLRDPRCVEPEHGLEHERRASGLVDRGVSTDEEQRETGIGKNGVHRSFLFRALEHHPERGDVSSASRNASPSASSAAATSRDHAERYATSLPYEARAASSVASWLTWRDSAAPRLRRSTRQGTSPPTRGPGRDSARRRRSNRPPAPSPRRRGRPAPAACHPAAAPCWPRAAAAGRPPRP